MLVLVLCVLSTVAIFRMKKTTYCVSYTLLMCLISSYSQCDMVKVHVQAGDRLEPDYNMENNPLYEMRILSNEGHSHNTQMPAPVPMYETIDNAKLHS